MALLDRVREAWDVLRGTSREEQETSSTAQAVADSPAQWARDDKAAVTSGESVEPVALDRGVAGNVATLALDSEPASVKRVENFLDHGTTDNDPTADRTSVQTPYVADPDRGQTSPDWETYEPRYTVAQQAVLAEAYDRLDAAIGPKHEMEFTFEKGNDDLFTYKHLPTENRIHLDRNADFYDVQDGREPTLTTRAEVLRAYQEPSPELAATLSAEHRETWVPLEKELGFHGADAFNHDSTRGDVRVYNTEWMEHKWQLGLDSKGQFYDVSENGPPKPVSREEALAGVHFEPSFYTPAERPLREAMGNDITPDLIRYEKSGDIQSYQYVPTASAVHIDSEGKFYNADREIITRDEALSTMQVAAEGGLQYIAPAPAQAPSGSPNSVGVSNAAVSEMPMSQGPVQPAVQEQSISM